MLAAGDMVSRYQAQRLIPAGTKRGYCLSSQDDNYQLPFIHLGGERHCERKLPLARRHDNALVFRRALSRVQPTNHEAVTVLCARQLLLHRIRMRYYITCRKLIKCNSKKICS